VAGSPAKQSRSATPGSGSEGERGRAEGEAQSPTTRSPAPPSPGSEKENVGAEDLFGDDLSVSSEDEADVKAKKKVIEDSEGDDVARYDDDEGPSKRRLDSDSDEGAVNREEREPAAMDVDKGEEEQVPETRIDVEVPKIQTDLGREIHFVKLPNFLSVESRPFDQDTYEDEMEDGEQQDEEGRTRLKLKVENTIRWRQERDKEGQPVIQSNARMVKWSDGSYSLHLGNEIFDVHKQPLQSDFNHLFIRQGTGLQGQAVFRTKLSFRPHSVDSHTHKKMTLSMADRSTKSNQIKVISHVGHNPDEGRWERIRKEEQGLREALRKDASKKRVKEKGASQGLSGGYLEDEDDDEEGAVSIAKIKAKYKSGGGAGEKKKPIYSDSDSDMEERKGKRLQKAKGGVDSDSASSRSRSRSSSSSSAGSRSRSASPASRKSKSSGSGSGSD